MGFADYGRKVVFAAFDGGEITSDAGLLLLREQARRSQLFSRMASCFTDRRDQTRVRHGLEQLLAQRICGIALGYEDVNDHDQLRYDPAFKMLSTPGSNDHPSALAGKSTLNRLEHSWENGDRRYHMLTPNLRQLSDLLVELFLDSHTSPPEQLILDIDATDIETHGK